MPSVTGTPASLRITGAVASTVPYRFDATGASLHLAGAVATVGPGTGTNLAGLDLAALGRLDRNILAKGFNSVEYQLRWQRLCEAIEAAINAISTQVNDNTVLLSRIAAAQALAQTANDNTTQVDQRTSLESSYTDPPKILTANASGVVTIAAHTRRYTNGTFAIIDAGSVSGLASGTTYWIYYSDAARAGGSVTFTATTNPIAQGGNIHVVGRITIPAAGEPDTDGGGPSAPGSVLEGRPPPEDGYEVF